ncbi:MAG: dihydrofolate reductase [Sarcina sp.]
MFSIIVAHSSNNSIGKDNQIPWYLPADLKRFKELTMGKKMIMGRKTFESLPGILPGRKHIILTKNKDYVVDNPNVEVITDLSTLIDAYQNSQEEVFIIGGGEIYKLFLAYASKLYITEVLLDVVADTKFPFIDTQKWNLDYQSEILEQNSIKYIYKNYSK